MKKEEKKLKIRKLPNTTDELVKEQFNIIIPQRFDSEKNFMIEVLKTFCINTAKQKNKSFKYFVEKFIEK
jgi:ribosomal protein L17